MCGVPPHPNIVALLGICVSESKQTIMIVFEFLRKGSLQSYLKHNISTTVESLCNICLGIASGMTHLARYNIVHNDLAARNVLIQEVVVGSGSSPSYEIIAKITDFGLASRETKSGAPNKTQMIPVRWTAPEVIEAEIRQCNEKTDVWSFGVVIYEVFTNCSHLPYKGLTNQKIVGWLKEGNRLEQPEQCPDWVYDLMMSCMKLHQEARPTFKEICIQMSENMERTFKKNALFNSPDSPTTTTDLYATSILPQTVETDTGSQINEEAAYETANQIYMGSL
eukprot:TRINITY_DN80_c0_g1_i1.p1 TRINITY_DN80_c0_g1~~TRINITY_DN80_c0_g1_i1.p1  ORF type:complete len:296 (-),score=82.16 TRINITY_DN80_c0_g1_i1:82-921(-)